MNKNVFFKACGNVFLWFKCIWSDIRFSKSIRHNIPLNNEDKVYSMSDIQLLLTRLCSKFTWTEDDVSQMYDAFNSPSQLYTDYINGSVKDDCDGYHALAYHCLVNNNIECCLFTANAPDLGHCILAFKYNDKWNVVDYNNIHQGYNSLEEAIDAYNIIYQKGYNTKPVRYNGLFAYDYEKGRYHLESLKKFS